MKTKVNKKTKTPEIIYLNLSGWTNPAANKPELVQAAKAVMKEINHHFRIKDGGWPLSYSHYVDDMFNHAYKHNLESYLINELVASGKYQLQSSPNGHVGLCISKIAKRKKTTKKTSK